MPRPAKGPRLWFNKKRGHWIILDTGDIQRGTGCGEDDLPGAEKALLRYLETRGLPAPVPNRYVYFVTAEFPDFPIKIGVSDSLRARAKGLQTSLPYTVQTLAVIKTQDPYLERSIHRKFKHLRMRGEWFRRAPELLDFITCASRPGFKIAANDIDPREPVFEPGMPFQYASSL